MIIKELPLEQPTTCSTTDTVSQVASLVKEKKARHVIIINEQQFPVGIISTIDIVTRVVAKKIDAAKITAEEIMTTPIMVKTIEDDVGEVYRIMTQQNIFSMPIVKEGKLQGLLTFQNALKHLTKGQ